MKRISSQLPQLDSSYYQRLREFDMNQMTNKIGAQSRIKDLDVAAEMVNFTKNQILQQAGTSILAQANSAPQAILTLLR